MKKMMLCLFAIATMLFATENTNAQKINFGAKAGLNLSTWNQADSQMKIGFHAGGYAQIKFNKMFAIQPEVFYSLEGNKVFREVSNPILGSEVYVRYNSNYNNHRIAVSVMFQFSPISRFTIEVGPQFNFNLGITQYTKLETGIAEEIIDERMRDSSIEGEVFELGLAAGVKFDLTNNISIGARYVYGLTPILGEVTIVDDDVFPETVVSEAVKTSNIMVSFNYGF